MTDGARRTYIALAAILVVATAALGLGLWVAQPPHPDPAWPTQALDLVPTSEPEVVPAGDVTRPNFRFSVVPGGVHSVLEMRQAMLRDPVVATHYAGLDPAKFRVEALPARVEAHVSYRKGDEVFWTRKKLVLKAGEKVLTDGTNIICARCGNRVSMDALEPDLPEEPAAEEFEQLGDPVVVAALPPAGPPDPGSLHDLQLDGTAFGSAGGRSAFGAQPFLVGPGLASRPGTSAGASSTSGSGSGGQGQSAGSPQGPRPGAGSGSGPDQGAGSNSGLVPSPNPGGAGSGGGAADPGGAGSGGNPNNPGGAGSGGNPNNQNPGGASDGGPRSGPNPGGHDGSDPSSNPDLTLRLGPGPLDPPGPGQGPGQNPGPWPGVGPGPGPNGGPGNGPGPNQGPWPGSGPGPGPGFVPDPHLQGDPGQEPLGPGAIPEPTPEPSTLVLTGLGVAGWYLGRLRRRSRARRS